VEMNRVDREPFSCDVVINGFWNRAILTPNGIAGRLFKLPPGSGIQVEVPLDGLLPARVTIDGLIVTVAARRLVIATETPTYSALDKAKHIAWNALEDLPETPVLSAGFNVRYKAPVENSSFVEKLVAPLDKTLSDLHHEILARTLIRRVRFKEGFLNVACSVEEPETAQLEFNFHRESKDRNALSEWLNMPCESFEPSVREILDALLDQ